MSIQDIIRQSQALPTNDKWRLVRHLLDDLQGIEATTSQEDWGSFVERMYGALADDPIERPAQLPFTERDSID